nr:restriction endonuclease subunit S [uncultured Deefgea sp.]
MSVRENWPVVRLEAHVDLLTGHPFKSVSFTDNPLDIPLVKGDNVQQSFIDWSRAKRWSTQAVSGLDKYWLQVGDVVLAMDRPWIEAGLKFAWIKSTDPKALLVQRVSRMRGINGLRTDYLRYLIASPAFTDYIKPIVTGVTVPHISPGQIKSFQFLLPPENVQDCVAAFLSAYDDLIENNTRRIAVLEEMARRIYEEWFVHFRYPGHEQAQKVETELGLVPEGWDCGAFTDLIEVMGGGTPKKDVAEYWDGSIPFFTPRDAPDCAYTLDTLAHISELGLSKCSSKKYPKNTVFITARGTVGKLALASRDMAMNQSCYALKGRDGYGQMYTYLTAQAAVLGLKAKSHGSVFDTIITDTFRLMRIVKPPVDLAVKLESIVEPMLSLSLKLSLKNANLRQTRDLLLPRLISGELDVSTLVLPDSE